MLRCCPLDLGGVAMAKISFLETPPLFISPHGLGGLVFKAATDAAIGISPAGPPSILIYPRNPPGDCHPEPRSGYRLLPVRLQDLSK